MPAGEVAGARPEPGRQAPRIPGMLSRAPMTERLICPGPMGDDISSPQYRSGRGPPTPPQLKKSLTSRVGSSSSSAGFQIPSSQPRHAGGHDRTVLGLPPADPTAVVNPSTDTSRNPAASNISRTCSASNSSTWNGLVGFSPRAGPRERRAIRGGHHDHAPASGTRADSAKGSLAGPGCSITCNETTASARCVAMGNRSGPARMTSTCG